MMQTETIDLRNKTYMPTTALSEMDTRSRILTAAQRLFRQCGYHATGINDILELAQAPKGSMYYHFPSGKEEIGVCVIEDMTANIIKLFTTSRTRSTEAMVLQVGQQLATAMEKTHYEICAIFAMFMAERKASPLLGEAVAIAYGSMVAGLQERLQADGLTLRVAHDKAITVMALLEGGSLLSHAQQDSQSFRLCVKQAAALCKITG